MNSYVHIDFRPSLIEMMIIQGNIIIPATAKAFFSLVGLTTVSHDAIMSLSVENKMFIFFPLF